jgi:hypothetical protein
MTMKLKAVFNFTKKDELTQFERNKMINDFCKLRETLVDQTNPLLEKWKPRYFIHGHVHKSYGHFHPIMTHSSGTTIVNSFDHQIIDFPESDFPARGQTGSPFYDLYISLQERKRL